MGCVKTPKTLKHPKPNPQVRRNLCTPQLLAYTLLPQAQRIINISRGVSPGIVPDEPIFNAYLVIYSAMLYYDKVKLTSSQRTDGAVSGVPFSAHSNSP